MIVLYDGAVFSAQSSGGVNRYFTNLIDRLPAAWTPVFVGTRRTPLMFPRHANLQTHWRVVPRWAGPFRRAIRERYFGRLLSRLHADLLHPTYYRLISGLDLRTSRWPIVLTVYDMIHERFAALVDPDGRHARMKRQALDAAQALICISENTKHDLLNIYPRLEPKVTVIPLASSLNWAMADERAEVPASPYFLYVGSRAPYKNFDRLLAAIAYLRATNHTIELAVVGRPFRGRELATIHNHGIQGYVRTFSLADDHQLAQLYRHSVALVYPSLYEGFGIPLLEAMQCHTAVIASNSSSIPEVAGSAALLVDPNSTEELASAMHNLLVDDRLRETLVARGRQRAQHFSWERTAVETVRCYESIVAQYASTRYVPRPCRWVGRPVVRLRI
jgi:glycosyltransferase involved in cell wall biosynthesis